MTNKEILGANLLDIIFENRNKDYGAYALRRGYNHRLLIAMGAAASVILLFILINALGKKGESVIPVINDNGGIRIRTIELPKELEKPKEVTKSKPVEKVATVKYVSVIKITPDKEMKITMPDITDMIDKNIGTENIEGTKYEGKVNPNNEPVTNPGIGKEPAQSLPEIIIDEHDPEFPGGPEALKRFLGSNLNTPGELEAGEKKMVRIRFKVDKDGAVSTLEIVSSGGSEYDREVIRVCKKMPHWKPAIQNGIHVAVSYVLPVTFIGAEQ